MLILAKMLRHVITFSTDPAVEADLFFFFALQIFFLSIFSTQLTRLDISYVTNSTIGSERTFSNFTCIYR